MSVEQTLVQSKAFGKRKMYETDISSEVIDTVKKLCTHSVSLRAVDVLTHAVNTIPHNYIIATMDGAKVRTMLDTAIKPILDELAGVLPDTDGQLHKDMVETIKKAKECQSVMEKRIEQTTAIALPHDIDDLKNKITVNNSSITDLTKHIDSLIERRNKLISANKILQQKVDECEYVIHGNPNVDVIELPADPVTEPNSEDDLFDDTNEFPDPDEIFIDLEDLDLFETSFDPFDVSTTIVDEINTQAENAAVLTVNIKIPDWIDPQEWRVILNDIKDYFSDVEVSDTGVHTGECTFICFK